MVQYGYILLRELNYRILINCNVKNLITENIQDINDLLFLTISSDMQSEVKIMHIVKS